MVLYLSKQTSAFFSSNIFTNVTVENVLEILREEPLLALDCETISMDPRRKSIIMLQFGTPKSTQIVIDTRDYPIELFREILEDTSKTFVGHNIKFDYNMLKAYRVLLPKVYDTMVVEKIIYNGMYDPVQAMRNHLRNLCVRQ